MTTEILKKNHILNLKIANREGETMSYDAVVNTITNEELLKSFSASVDVANLAIIKNFKLASLAKTTNLKGFRLGKAPLSVVWNQHQGELTKEIVNDTINDVTQEIVNVVGSTLIMAPQINLKHFSFEKGLEFEASLNLLPQVDLPEVTDVTLEKFTYEIESKDIQERVQELMTRNKKFVKAENTHKAANGDKVVIDFEGKIDGVAFPGGTAKKTLLELGSRSFIDNFEDQLLKHKVGDHVDVKVAFPQDYHQKDFAGKKAEFAVDIHEIQQAVAYENEEDFWPIYHIHNAFMPSKRKRNERTTTHSTLTNGTTTRNGNCYFRRRMFLVYGSCFPRTRRRKNCSIRIHWLQNR